jgi:hypothetical protein
MRGHNEFRTRFYDEVIRMAEEKLRTQGVRMSLLVLSVIVE